MYNLDQFTHKQISLRTFICLWVNWSRLYINKLRKNTFNPIIYSSFTITELHSSFYSNYLPFPLIVKLSPLCLTLSNCSLLTNICCNLLLVSIFSANNLSFSAPYDVIFDLKSFPFSSAISNCFISFCFSYNKYKFQCSIFIEYQIHIDA